MYQVNLFPTAGQALGLVTTLAYAWVSDGLGGKRWQVMIVPAVSTSLEFPWKTLTEDQRRHVTLWAWLLSPWVRVMVLRSSGTSSMLLLGVFGQWYVLGNTTVTLSLTDVLIAVCLDERNLS